MRATYWLAITQSMWDDMHKEHEPPKLRSEWCTACNSHRHIVDWGTCKAEFNPNDSEWHLLVRCVNCRKEGDLGRVQSLKNLISWGGK